MTIWQKTAQKKEYPKLSQNLQTDVVIIGGGITGVLNAYFLSRSGKKVVLIEKNELGSNATICTTAFITKIIDSDLSEIVSLYGEADAKTIWNSGQAAIDEFEKLISDEKIECEFKRCSDYAYANTEKQFEDIKKEIRVYQKFGIKASLHEDGSALGFPNSGYMEIPGQAKFDVAKFLYRLAELAEENGAQIFEHTEATDIDGEKPLVTVGDFTVQAEDAVIATYKPFTNEKTHLKKGMYKSYVMSIDLGDENIIEGIYEDADNPYHYFRIDRGDGQNRMILGGEDHKDIFGNTLDEKSSKALEEYARRLLPKGNFKITERWDGPILEPSDGLPLIGRIKPHYYVATAFSGNGMTYSMISALLISDLILGKENAWQGIYDPTRALLRPKELATKAKDYIEELFEGAVKNLFK